MIRVQPGGVDPEDIRKLRLFSVLSDTDLKSLAAHAEKVTFESKDRIVTEGNAGDYFYVIVSGEVRVLREDDGGARQPLSSLGEGAFFGQEALLSGRLSTVTVEGVETGTLLRFSAQSFRIFEADPQLSKVIREMSGARSAVNPHSFRGQTPGELCLAAERRHPYALAESIIAPVLAAIAMSIGLAVLAGQGALGAGSILAVGTLLAVALTIWVVWLIADWWNDQYIVTTRRVIEIERVLLFYEKRLEAPIERIQSVNISTPFPMGNLVGYQDVLIKTGSSARPIKFAAVANAERLQQKILDARNLAVSQETLLKPGEIEDDLRRRLEGAEGAAGSQPAPADDEIIDDLPRPVRGSSVWSVLWHAVDYLIPRVEEHRKTAIVWRRHPFILLRQVILPLLCALLLVPLSVLALFDASPLVWFFQFPGGWLLLGFLNVGVLVWLLWSYEDWHNDYYAVTDTQIIDRNSLPLGISEDKRAGPFDAIQNVDVDVSGFFRVLLDMGDVLVSTSGQGEAFTFDSMFRPREVQQEIMRRLDAYRDRVRQRQAQQRRSEMADWFAAYRGLTEGTNSDKSSS